MIERNGALGVGRLVAAPRSVVGPLPRWCGRVRQLVARREPAHHEERRQDIADLILASASPFASLIRTFAQVTGANN